MHRTVDLTSFLLRRDTKESNYSLESPKYIRYRGLVGFLHIHIRKRAGKPQRMGNTVFLPERLGAITGTMSVGRTSPDSTMGLQIV